MTRPLPLRCSLLVAAVVLGACDRSPAEPVHGSAAPPQPAAPAARGLSWSVPPGWSTDKTASAGRYRARYRVAPVGDDRLPAEALVLHLGRGPGADVDRALARWRDDFEKVAPDGIAEGQLRAGELTARVVELSGTYKYPLGPALGPAQRSAAQVLKPGWRGIAAAVDAGHRGVYWFQLVGPDETVAAARSAMHDLVRSAR